MASIYEIYDDDHDGCLDEDEFLSAIQQAGKQQADAHRHIYLKALRASSCAKPDVLASDNSVYLLLVLCVCSNSFVVQACPHMMS